MPTGLIAKLIKAAINISISQKPMDVSSTNSYIYKQNTYKYLIRDYFLNYSTQQFGYNKNTSETMGNLYKIISIDQI